jgi:hypothetical protein
MWHIEGRREKYTGFWWQWCLKEDTTSIPGTDGRVTYRVLVAVVPQGRHHLYTWYRWEGNIKMGLKEI